MARDFLESLNRRLTGLYDKLTGAVPGDNDLRPRDVVRRIVEAMEDRQREGLDGNVYVPNVYTLQVAVEDDDERQYLRTFLGADELAAALADEISARGYSVRGMLVFTVEEVKPAKSVNAPPTERVKVLCKFDPEAGRPLPLTPSPSSYILYEGRGGTGGDAGRAGASPAPTPIPPALLPSEGEERLESKRGRPASDEPGTLPAVIAALAQLTLISDKGTAGKSFSIGVSGTKVGRGKNSGNSVVLENDPLISKIHARIAFEKSGFVVYDENSMNGTTVNGRPVTASKAFPLNDGDELQIGDVRLRFEEFGGDKTQPRRGMPHNSPLSPTVTPTFTPTFAPTISGGAAFCLVAGDGTVFPLASQMTIGRALTEDISLVGNGVAAHHARLSAREEAVYVEDVGTPAGTFVNGERIPANFPVALYPDDQVAFGEVLLRVQRGYNRSS